MSILLSLKFSCRECGGASSVVSSLNLGVNCEGQIRDILAFSRFVPFHKFLFTTTFISNSHPSLLCHFIYHASISFSPNFIDG